MKLNLEFVWHSGVFLIVCLCMFYASKLVFQLFNGKVKVSEELVDKDNTSFYVAYVSYYVGVLSVIGGIMGSDGNGNFWEEVLLTLLYGGIGIVLLNLIIVVIDNVLHRKVDLWQQTKDGVLAIGILKGGSYISTGIIIAGVMLTEVDKPVQTSLYLLGALIFASVGYFYFNLTTPFNSTKEIYKGNAAVAISAAGAQVAFALLIYAGFQIEHHTWVHSLQSIGVEVFGGIILLPLVRFLLDFLFIPKHRKITEELIEQEIPNVGLGIFEAASYIGGALLFIWCWNL